MGSIIEYYYTLDLAENFVFDSHWILSNEWFTKSAKFSLKPYRSEYSTMSVRWSWQGLPPGTVAPKEGPDRIVRLETSNIPAFQTEDFMPPENEMKARVDFIYSEDLPESDAAGFWKKTGKKLNGQLEDFVGKRKAMEQIVAQMVSPNDPPEVKARKIYARVQQVRNTSYEASKTEQEQKRDKEKAPGNVEDVWKRGYGDGVQLTWLYLALVAGGGNRSLRGMPANDVFIHRYGDCKDKATLMASMLHEIGMDSYYVVINSQRGSVTPDMPAHLGGFNHMILAIKLPDGLTNPLLVATLQHPRLGKLLFFDPTNELTPFGQIGGYLQGNYGLLVTPDGGELVEVPRQPLAMNGIERTAKLVLDATGTLKGEVNEVRTGDRASSQRWALRTTTKDIDRIKPIEELLAGSVSTFEITHASIVNLTQTDLPFGFNYSFEAMNYAKSAGNLLLVRPRVIGSKSSGLLETREPRNFSIEFEGPAQDTDTFEIALPPGYEVDDLPPPVDVDYSFASYHSEDGSSGECNSL